MRARWRWALLGLLGLAAALALGSALLFSGSEVTCAESPAGREPRLSCDLVVAAPPETVWRSLTGTGEPRPYYFDAVLEAEMRPGGRWRFVTEDRTRLLAGGEIVALEPPRRFVQSFQAADLEDAASRIAVELEPVTGGTQVRLVHDGFARETATYRRFRRAHPLALSAMKAHLETGELPLRARIYTALFKPGMKLATVRAEPWD